MNTIPGLGKDPLIYHKFVRSKACLCHPPGRTSRYIY